MSNFPKRQLLFSSSKSIQTAVSRSTLEFSEWAHLLVVEFNVRVPEGCVQPLNTCCRGLTPAIGGLQLVSSGLSWVGKYILHYMASFIVVRFRCCRQLARMMVMRGGV